MNKDNNGLTIIDIIGIVVSCVVLILIIIPQYQGQTHLSKIDKEIREVKLLQNSIKDFYKKFDRYPTPSEFYETILKCSSNTYYKYVTINQTDSLNEPIRCEPNFPKEIRDCTPVRPEYALNLWRLSHQGKLNTQGYFIICQHTGHKHLEGDFVYADDLTEAASYVCPY